MIVYMCGRVQKGKRIRGETRNRKMGVDAMIQQVKLKPDRVFLPLSVYRTRFDDNFIAFVHVKARAVYCRS